MLITHRSAMCACASRSTSGPKLPVERPAFSRLVAGSNPGGPTKLDKIENFRVEVPRPVGNQPIAFRQGRSARQALPRSTSA